MLIPWLNSGNKFEALNWWVKPNEERRNIIFTADGKIAWLSDDFFHYFRFFIVGVHNRSHFVHEAFH